MVNNWHTFSHHFITKARLEQNVHHEEIGQGGQDMSSKTRFSLTPAEIFFKFPENFGNNWTGGDIFFYQVHLIVKGNGTRSLDQDTEDSLQQHSSTESKYL